MICILLFSSLANQVSDALKEMKCICYWILGYAAISISDKDWTIKLSLILPYQCAPSIPVFRLRLLRIQQTISLLCRWAIHFYIDLHPQGSVVLLLRVELSVVCCICKEMTALYIISRCCYNVYHVIWTILKGEKITYFFLLIRIFP